MLLESEDLAWLRAGEGEGHFHGPGAWPFGVEAYAAREDNDLIPWFAQHSSALFLSGARKTESSGDEAPPWPSSEGMSLEAYRLALLETSAVVAERP